MIDRIQIYESSSVDPYVNLAIEKHLLENAGENCCVLYLWQNQNTVVIGRNQNAWKECRISLLESEGGKLARRLSGGGAVFHDLGNLNFTFLMTQENYDLDRQLSVIQTACRSLGIRAEKSGRNDILVDGRKFSGNAFYHSQGRAYHHGTLLVDVDMDKLSRYLSPPKAKLEAKGVASVRSRVVNLKEYAPQLTCDIMKQHMADAFTSVYALPAETISLSDAALAAINQDSRKNASWQWLYGTALPFTFRCEERFSWGSIQLQLQVVSGIVENTRVYTDAMDWSVAQRIEEALTGCRFNPSDLQNVLCGTGLSEMILQDLFQMLDAQDI